MSDLELRIKSIEIASVVKVDANEFIQLSEAIYAFLTSGTIAVGAPDK